MKRTFVICFQSSHLGFNIIIPLSDSKEYPTMSDAEDAVKIILEAKPNMEIFILPKYTKE